MMITAEISDFQESGTAAWIILKRSSSSGDWLTNLAITGEVFERETVICAAFRLYDHRRGVRAIGEAEKTTQHTRHLIVYLERPA